MSGQRAFAQKLNKTQQAADIRREVSSTISGRDGSKYGSFSSKPGSVPLSDVVDPLDFEDYLFKNQYQATSDPLKRLLDFPEDDLSVVAVKREFRTVKVPQPEQDAESNNILVKDCLHWYTCDWAVASRKYEDCVKNHEYDKIRQRQKDLVASREQTFEVDVAELEDQASQTDEGFDKRSSIHLENTPRGSWASSIFNLHNSEADDLYLHLLERVDSEEQDQMNAAVRMYKRQSDLMCLYPPPEDADAIERRNYPNIPREHFGYRLLVKCDKLQLEVDIEPIFACMALYDAKEKKKISENFYFDLNTDTTRNMVKQYLGQPDLYTVSHSAIFSLTYPSSDVFLVIKLEKVLQSGDVSVEPYMKDKDTTKHVEKARGNAKFYCDRLGAYRMPFAWTAVQLLSVISDASNMEKEGEGERRANSLDRRKIPGSDPMLYNSLPRKGSDAFGNFKRNGSERRSFYLLEEELKNLEDFHPLSMKVSNLFIQEGDKLSDESLYKFLQDLKRPTSVLKKLKTIPCQLKLDISPVSEEHPYCLTPELCQVKPYPDMKTRPTREIEEFPTRPVYVPHYHYKNTLYVYPRSLNFSNRPGSARNIAVKVEFMTAENHNTECIYAKSSTSLYKRFAYTSVTYHSRSPEFYEEIKIKLPADLKDTHHLLFTFYHISCQKKQDNTPVETPIGYTWLPLLKNHRLQTGDFSLPVAIDHPMVKDYSKLPPEVGLPSMKFVDGKKQLFHVTVSAVSSIHSQDAYIDNFLKLCHSVEDGQIPRAIGEHKMEDELRRSVLELNKAADEPLVKFLYIIMDKLFLMMIRSPVIAGRIVNMGQQCFEAIANIVDRIHTLLDNSHDSHGRNNLLSSFLHYVFIPPDADDEGTVVEGQPPRSPTSPSSFNIPPGYGTIVARSTSLNFKSRMVRPNSASLSIPNSPDQDIEAFLESQFGNLDSSRTSPNRFSQSATGMGNVPVIGYGGRLPPKKLVQEEIALQLMVSSGDMKEKTFKHAWFFFDIMIKNMAQQLADAEKLDSPRQTRFSESFCNDIGNIVTVVTADIIARYNRDVRAIELLNSHLAFFMRDLFSLMDRGFVMGLIHKYCKQVSGKIVALSDPTTLALLKLDFLRIICSHEHYVTLNLPFQSTVASRPPSPTLSISSMSSILSLPPQAMTPAQKKMTELSLEFRQQHFLTGLLLSDLACVLQTRNVNLHRQAIDTLLNLLACHDADPRFKDEQCRIRVAALYLPLLGICMDALPQINCSNADPKARPSATIGYDLEPTAPLNQTVAMAIAGTSVYARDNRQDSSVPLQRAQSHTQLTEESTKDLLICFMWVIKNVDPATLQQWFGTITLQRLNQLLDLFFFSICAFEYKGKSDIMKSPARMSMKRNAKQQQLQKLENVILGNTGARSEMMQRLTRHGSIGPERFNPSLGQSERLRWRKEQTNYRQNAPEEYEKTPLQLEEDAILEGQIATEVSMTVLDTLELLIQTISVTDNMQGALTGVMKVLLHMLALNQSTLVMENVLATQRSLVFKYPELLFEEETEQCADLSLRLLRHCSSCISQIRSHASASLYLLMRQNFEIGNNFARVKMQVTMSLSSLVGMETNFNEEYLRRSLKTILTYAEEDVELHGTTFTEQVKDLVFNLHMILSDTVKMKEFQEDPEMLLDLMYRIAKGYRNSPDLRLTWLQNMASKHTERMNFTEAAQCLVHAAGLVAEYLHMLEDKPYLPVGCVSLEKITPNVLEESAVSDDVVSPDQEGICTGKYFTESGLVGLLEHAAASFNQAGMYESVNLVYKTLIPIHEASREFKKLSIIHGKLQEAFNKICSQGGKRLFSTYFRVGFYGPKFGDLDGEEYIYKEPAITKLPEIASRLESFYSERFGTDFVEIIKDSNTVDCKKLNPEKAYIQITFVEPYFDFYETLHRHTAFELYNNIKRFVFATPFTKDGKAHGDIGAQYKRKTILTTAHSFPYIKTRVSIIKREEVVLSPAEVAIEDIQKKTHELTLATLQEPPDAKMLQMVLQGCIGTTVNQGPMEVALIFLDGDDLPLDKHRNKLRLCLKELSRRCGDALRKNKSLITFEQKEYQRELERNYHRFTDRLMPLIKKKRIGNTGTVKRSGKRLSQSPGGAIENSEQL
ncbi:Dedicator of cytokinesis protein 7 [Holothuria leucospilota]|uniref:Dedicator of cytokinesis protein 7 n=1 Tax=Holothuria leucospilota TaxID=206669 RepID=A0A9Q1HBZ5_HOLLE|nr:Dedicator of cytokinesis protein 7 [Holothuria leucospilota]